MHESTGPVASNPQEAQTEGRNSEDVADTFQGLVNEFETLSSELDSAAPDEGIGGAFTDFYLEHKAAVQAVEAHGTDMAGNVQGGAARTMGTDGYVVSEFQDALGEWWSIFFGGSTSESASIPTVPGGFLDPLSAERLNDLGGS